jgi:FkbM family methyltransferase
MKYFIDCGAHKGESARLFRKEYPSAEEFKIICFEPNPDLVEHFKDQFFDDIEFHNVAVSTFDGEADFFTHQWTVGNTLVSSATRLVNVPPRKVPVINFGRWLRERVTPEDFVILKLDVEGLEYELLPHLFQDGSFDLVNKLYIEWHDGNRKLDPGVHESVRNQVLARGLKDWYWEAAKGVILGKDE